MVTKRTTFRNMNQQGSTLIEVLVAIVVLAIGLLGLAGLQVRLQAAEIDAYQRSQALILLNDMASRLAANRNAAAAYVAAAPDSNPVGVGMTCPTPGVAATRQEQDIAEWCNALQGAAETTGTGGSKVSLGAMAGGRGCVANLTGGVFRVTVVWQGLTPIGKPANVSACGANSYDSAAAGAVCTGDRCRRVLSTLVRIAIL